MKRVCEVCGLEFDEHWMESYSSGRKTHWYCWDCWKKGQREILLSEGYRQKRLYKMHLSKKRDR